MARSRFTYIFISSTLIFTLIGTNLVFAASQVAEYLCEVGIAYYRIGKMDYALEEFNHALVADPNNKKAKEFINKIFEENTPSAPLAKEKPVKLASSAPKKNRQEVMDEEMKNLSAKEPPICKSYAPEENKAGDEEERGFKVAGLKITGEAQASFGFDTNNFVWKRANFDLNEKYKSWRMTSTAAYNRKFNTYDPKVYDSLSTNIDTTNEEGFNFHGNITMDPWSFTGRSNKTTITGANGDVAEVELKYWSNTGYVINNTAYTLKQGDTIAVPELKVVDERTSSVSMSSNRNATNFTLPAMKIYRRFQPMRELWLEYAQEPVAVKVFPIGYQDQAYTSDDPLMITNRRIWWQESLWLRKYTPGIYYANTTPVSFMKGYWDDSLSFLSKDSMGVYLTGLRGASFSFLPLETTSFNATVATPVHLWQDYTKMDNLIATARLKHYFVPNLQAGATFTSRSGFKTDPSFRRDSQNFVSGIDLGYEVVDGVKASLEVLNSNSNYDISNSQYKSRKSGFVYYMSLVGRFPFESIMDLKYGYDDIKRGKGEPFLMKVRLFASRMDRGFDTALSNFHNTRSDTSWSRYIHFRKPFKYYFSGLKEPTTRWDELNATRIGDGIDIGRDTLGFRLEIENEDNFSNLLDARNVHKTSGKNVETVIRDEAMLKLTDKLIVKGLAIYQHLPKTTAGIDPYVYSGNTGEFWRNASVKDETDPSIKSGSVGLNYELFDWLSISGIYERTNDYSLAYGDFPRNAFRNDTTLSSTYTNDDRLYRALDPFLYSQQVYPQAPYPYYNIFKTAFSISPLENMELYLDYTRNEYAIAGQDSDNMNHVGFECSYMPTKKLGLTLKYTYSRWKDPTLLLVGDTGARGHHNFFGEFRFLPTDDDELTLQYGEGNTSPYGNITLDPYGGTLLTMDTAHIVRAYYRRKF